MQFLIKAYDGPNMLEKRMAVRPRHLEGMKALGRQIIVAGGLLDESGKMKGSALVMDFPDRAALDEYLNHKASAHERRTIMYWEMEHENQTDA